MLKNYVVEVISVGTGLVGCLLRIIFVSDDAVYHLFQVAEFLRSVQCTIEEVLSRLKSQLDPQMKYFGCRIVSLVRQICLV